MHRSPLKLLPKAQGEQIEERKAWGRVKEETDDEDADKDLALSGKRRPSMEPEKQASEKMLFAGMMEKVMKKRASEKERVIKFTKASEGLYREMMSGYKTYTARFEEIDRRYKEQEEREMQSIRDDAKQLSLRAKKVRHIL